MAVSPRWFLPDQPLHVIQRGHNRQAIFHRERDYRLYLKYLREAAQRNDLAIHAYVLMTNHVHLLATPEAEHSLPRTMQSLGRRYVAYYNAAHGRSGTLWEGRYRCAPVDTEAYLIACSRYIELNPVRAGMVAAPREYPWSSHRRNAEGANDPLVSEHALYGALATTPADRQAAYRGLFAEGLQEAQLTVIRESTNRGWALGGDAFRSKISRQLRRPAASRPRGRPRKAPSGE